MKFLSSLYYFFKLNILKIILFPRIRSAKDYDRLRFEFELCRVASNKKKVLYVGIHERSFVYQLVFPFVFCDMDTSFLIYSDNERTEPCQNDNNQYDLVVLSGVFGYGTDENGFENILNKQNFENFLVLDWIKNIDLHNRYIDPGLGYTSLKRSFFYYTDKTKVTY